jgi:hypothetical protein
MSPPKRIVRFLKRRREPGEIATPVASVRNLCLECCGYVPSEVALCTAPCCWLWPWRFGCRPEAAARRGLDVGLNAPDTARLLKKGGQAPGFPSATASKPAARRS